MNATGGQPTVDVRVSGQRKRRVAVRDAAEARRVCAQAIAESSCGASTWQGGALRRNGRTVARLTYNGRLWDPQPCPHCQELTDDFNVKGA